MVDPIGRAGPWVSLCARECVCLPTRVGVWVIGCERGLQARLRVPTLPLGSGSTWRPCLRVTYGAAHGVGIQALSPAVMHARHIMVSSWHYWSHVAPRHPTSLHGVDTRGAEC